MIRLRLSLLLLLSVAAWSADAPTEGEWLPIRRVLASNPQAATGDLERLLRSHPKWADGHRELARAQLFAKDGAKAYAAARAAMVLEPADTEAASLAVVALGMQNRINDALKVATFFDGKDPKGKVAFRTAEVLASAGRWAEAGAKLDLALAAQGVAADADLHVLGARIALANGDLAAAETAYLKALAARAAFPVAQYELGRVRIQLASQDEARRGELLDQAVAMLGALAKVWVKDGSYQLAHGKALLERGRHRQAGGDEGGAADVRAAVGPLRAGHELLPDDRNGRLWLGDALLRGERYEEALPHLQAAFAAGAPDRALPFNLALALNRCGKPKEAEALLAGLKAATPQESITLGMQNAKARTWELAADLLSRGVAGLPDASEAERAAVAASWRWIGHCRREQAATAKDPADKERLLDLARDAYGQAGDRHDRDAQRWFMAVESARQPEHAYAAAWRQIGWDGIFAFPAWQQVIAHYGAATTGGAGISGMAARKPLHLAVWSLLILLPAGLCLWSFLHRPKPQPEAVRAKTARAQAGPPPPTAASDEDSANAVAVKQTDTGALERRTVRPAPPKAPARRAAPPPPVGDSPFAPGKTKPPLRSRPKS